MSNGVPKFLRLKNLEELGIAKSHQAVRHMQMHYGFPLGRLLGPGTKSGPKTRLTNGWPVGRSSRRSKHASARSGRLRRGACLPRARCLTGAPLEWSFSGGGHRTGSTNKTIEVCLLSLRLWPRLRLQCTGAGAARRTQRAGETRQIKKREQKQEPRHVTNDAAASAQARKAAYAAEEEEGVLTPEEERRRHALFQEHLGEVLAEHDKAVPEEPDKTEEWVSPIEDRDGKWVILYRTVFGTFDSEEAARGGL